MKRPTKPDSAVPTSLELNKSLRAAASMLVKTYDSINWNRLVELEADCVELTFLNADAKESAVNQIQTMESSCAQFVEQECNAIRACLGTVAQRLRQGQQALDELHRAALERKVKQHERKSISRFESEVHNQLEMEKGCWQKTRSLQKLTDELPDTYLSVSSHRPKLYEHLAALLTESDDPLAKGLGFIPRPADWNRAILAGLQKAKPPMPQLTSAQRIRQLELRMGFRASGGELGSEAKDTRWMSLCVFLGGYVVALARDIHESNTRLERLPLTPGAFEILKLYETILSGGCLKKYSLPIEDQVSDREYTRTRAGTQQRAAPHWLAPTLGFAASLALTFAVFFSADHDDAQLARRAWGGAAFAGSNNDRNLWERVSFEWTKRSVSNSTTPSFIAAGTNLLNN